VEKIEIRDKKSKEIIMRLIEWDIKKGCNVFKDPKKRNDFKENIEKGEIPKKYYFELWDLIGLYGLADREHIEYLYEELTNKNNKLKKTHG